MSDGASDLADPALVEALGRVLGDRYRFVSRLGAGAFGEVYRIHDTMLERDVAVKRVRLDAYSDTGQRKELRERTIREAKVSARLKHPHIVTIYDVVDRPDMSFIVMEYIDGITLSRLLKEQGRLSLEETIRVLAQTASALDFAHGRGIVHRDIKPANIMIEAANGNVKVTDFGIAKSDAFADLTAAGSVLGTPNYMPPEQARGEPIDKRADLFSLGCVLYECLVGQKAFVGKTVMATLMTIMHEPPRPFDGDALGLHPAIGTVLERALAKDPAARFAAGMELVDALASLPRLDPGTVAVGPAMAPSAPAQVITRREPGDRSSFDPGVQGSLEPAKAAELIRELYRARSTGILHFEREGAAKRIYFKKGNIVFANSDVDHDRLGELLIRAGEIDRATFERVSDRMRSRGQRLGATLIEMEILTVEKLDELVRRQVQEIVFSVFDWDRGNFGFEILDPPVEEDIVVDLSTAELILAGVRRMGSLDHIRSALGSLDRVLRHTESPLLLYQKMTLTPSEGYVLSRVDGATSVAEIAAISPLGEDETLRCVFALVAAGVVELAARTVAPTSRISSRAVRQQEKEARAPETAEPPRATASQSASESPDRETALLEEIAAKHASLLTASHYELLEISPGASDEEIKRGYYAMAKKYHPDRHHLPRLRDLQGLLEELFAKITLAYEELSDPASRRRYDGARQVESRAAVAEGARDPVAGPSSSYVVPPEVVAERHYQQAYAHFQNMQYFDAIQCVRESVRMVPAEPRYHKLLALALSKNPKWRMEAEEHFMIALKGDEFDLDCLQGLAEIYESADMRARATSVYERILAYDPDNAVAREKLGKSGGKPRRPG